MDKAISLICRSMDSSEPTSVPTKRRNIRENMEPTPAHMLSNTNHMAFMYDQDDQADQSGCDVTDEELKLAKKFISMVGGGERAQKIMDKAYECEDCLGMLDSEDEDMQVISQISSMIPTEVDMPMGY